MKVISTLKGNSLLFSIYICESLICSIIKSFLPIPNLSVVLMIGLIIMSFILNPRIQIKKLTNILVLWIFIQIILVISMLKNGFYNVSSYWIYFTFFGTTAAIISLNDIDIQRVCKYITILYLIYFVAYFIMLRKTFLNGGDSYYGDSMSIGYAMTPIVFVALLQCFYGQFFKQDKKIIKLMYVDSIVALFIIVIDCRGRGPVLAIIIAGVVILLSKLKGIKRISFILGGGICTILIADNFMRIVQYLYDFFKGYNIELLFLNKIIYLSKTDLGILNGRDKLFDNAILEIMKSPIIGHGIGYYESLEHSYVHNFILDILLDIGGIGLLTVLILFFYCMRNIFKMHDRSKTVEFLLLFFVGELVLNFSSSMWLYPCFWLMTFRFINLINRKSADIIQLNQKNIKRREDKKW